MLPNSTNPVQGSTQRDTALNGKRAQRSPLPAPEVIAPATIYGFAVSVMQRLNDWPTDGAQDYATRVQELTHCVTASGLRTHLDEHVVRCMSGSLTGVIRAVSEIPGRDYERRRVTALGLDAWRVELELLLDEETPQNGRDYRYLRMPVRIVRSAIAQSINPFGLAWDGYAGRVTELGSQRGTGRW